jgi:glutathione S-transferase
MGEIPVLEEDGERLTQTAPILLRLADRYGRFQGRTHHEKDEVLRWLFWDNHKLSGYVATYRFMRTFTEKPDPQVLKYHLWRIRDCLGIIDGHFADRPFVAGDIPTIADLSMSAYLSFPVDETGFDLAATHPNVRAWLGRIAALPGWRSPYELLPGRRLVRYA